MSADKDRGVLRIEIPIESDDELAALNGALLAARATELSQMRRRGDRLAFGYGSDSVREPMTDEVDQAERRWMMLDRVLAALKDASRTLAHARGPSSERSTRRT